MGNVNHSSLRVDAVLSSIISTVCREKWFLDRLKICSAPAEFASELQSIVETISKSSNYMHVVTEYSTAEFSMWICDGLTQIGYDKLVAVEDGSFQNLKLRAVDSINRSHEYTITFLKPDRALKPSLCATLPETVTFDWGPGFCFSLLGIVTAVEAAVRKYENFFQVFCSFYRLSACSYCNCFYCLLPALTGR